MNGNHTMLDRLAERVMDLDSPAYGDERERAVSLESNSFGLTVGLYVALLGALIASAFGLILLPVALLAMAVIPAAASSWYARRRAVHRQKLIDESGVRSAMLAIIGYGAGMLLTFAAMTYTVFAGRPLLAAPSVDLTAETGFLGGIAHGAVIGGMLGGLATIAGGLYSFRRATAAGRPPSRSAC